MFLYRTRTCIHTAPRTYTHIPTHTNTLVHTTHKRVPCFPSSHHRRSSQQTTTHTCSVLNVPVQNSHMHTYSPTYIHTHTHTHKHTRTHNTQTRTMFSIVAPSSQQPADHDPHMQCSECSCTELAHAYIQPHAHTHTYPHTQTHSYTQHTNVYHVFHRRTIVAAASRPRPTHAVF